MAPGSRRVAVVAGAGTALATFLCACASDLPIRRRVAWPATTGTASDVRMQPGAYGSYEVTSGCDGEVTTLFGVRGHGQRRIALKTHEGWDDEMVALRDRLEAALGDAVLFVSFGRGCHGEDPAIRVIVGSFRQVDAAIARLGAFLQAEDRGDEAVIELRKRHWDSPRVLEINGLVPRARPPFWPYEIALGAGARWRDDWHPELALHLGRIWGRARGASLDGWFWGLGLEGRWANVGADAGEDLWSGGPVVRAGWAFGLLDKEQQWPTDVTNRGTYVYAQAGATWGTDDAAAVGSIGFTTLAGYQHAFTHLRMAGSAIWWLPLLLFNHAEVGIESNGAYMVLLGFSL